MTKNTLLGLVTAAALGVVATTASAATTGTIDFTVGPRSTANNPAPTSGSVTGYPGITWTAIGFPGIPNSDQPYDGGDNPEPNPLELAFVTDGYGIGDDEIGRENSESITINFNSVVQFLGFAFLDLFAGAGGTGESGIATIDGTAYELFFDTPVATNGGYAQYSFASPVFGTSVKFTAGLNNDVSGSRDGALAALQIAPVPLPAGMLLLATALGGFGVARRLRKAA